MMKKLILPLLLLLLFVPSALGETRVFDNADVLTASEEQKLEEAIVQIQNEFQFDVVLLTESSIGGETPYIYAERFYDNGAFGFGENRDGIILLLVTGGGAGNRDYNISNTGRSIKIFNESAMDRLEDAMLPSLRKSDYASGMSGFVSAVRDRLIAYQPQNRALRVLPFTLLGGLAVGLTVALILRYQMRTVRRKPNASSYERPGSFQLTRVQDLYLYTTTTRRRIESSSGSRSGGGGGGGHSHRSGKF